jgi:hypothetical protein
VNHAFLLSECHWDRRWAFVDLPGLERSNPYGGGLHSPGSERMQHSGRAPLPPTSSHPAIRSPPFGTPCSAPTRKRWRRASSLRPCKSSNACWLAGSVSKLDRPVRCLRLGARRVWVTNGRRFPGLDLSRGSFTVRRAHLCRQSYNRPGPSGLCWSPPAWRLRLATLRRRC